MINGARGHWARVQRAMVLGGVVAAAFVAVIVSLDLAFPPPLHKGSEVGQIIVDRDGRWLHAFATREGRWRFQVNVDTVDPEFVDRLIEIEDRRFFAHPGVDVFAIARALRQAAMRGRIVSGASTITMQTARLLEPRPRTISSKIIEIFRALQIERRLSKDEILSLYLTLAPYGGNIEGVRAASLLYFGKDPAALSVSEQALLIALPQAPEARRPDRHRRAARTAARAVVERLIKAGKLPPTYKGRALAIPDKRRELPRFAYHGARRAANLTRHLSASDSTSKSDTVSKSAATAKSGRALTSDIVSTLDIDVQQTVERVLADHARQIDRDVNIAAIVIVPETGEIIAYAGSADFMRAGGWIDMNQAVRSPGSLLKPFIYGLAFEDGTALPHRILSDEFRTINGYRPENFDRRYRGDVRLKDALRHSLNVPAVAALSAVGPNRFAALLANAGVNLRLPARALGTEVGLPVALGGAGLRPIDIAILYTGLARGGEVIPVSLISPKGDIPQGYRIFSSENARRVSAILSSVPAPKGRLPGALANGVTPLAWKTGTSYGYRDAWAAGYTDKHVVVVWTGRPDGTPRKGATGRRVAAPILFDIADALATRSGPRVTPQNDDLVPLMANRPRVYALPEATGPKVLFPPNGAELYINRNADGSARGVALSARSDTSPVNWFIGGERLSDPENWIPQKPGFYQIEAVDANGDADTVIVQIVGGTVE